MNEGEQLAKPDSTGVRTALWRAMHVQVGAAPSVPEDEVDLELVAPNEEWRSRPDMDPTWTSGLLASMVSRARFIEDLVLEKAAGPMTFGPQAAKIFWSPRHRFRVPRNLVLEERMNTFDDFLANIETSKHRARVSAVLSWVAEKYPDMERQIKWNQPIFIDHGTFIIGFSVAKNHVSVSPEAAGIEQFAAEIVEAGYTHTKNLLRIPFGEQVDYALLEKLIDFNIVDKAECSNFWRK